MCHPFGWKLFGNAHRFPLCVCRYMCATFAAVKVGSDSISPALSTCFLANIMLCHSASLLTFLSRFVPEYLAGRSYTTVSCEGCLLRPLHLMKNVFVSAFVEVLAVRICRSTIHFNWWDVSYFLLWDHSPCRLKCDLRLCFRRRRHVGCVQIKGNSCEAYKILRASHRCSYVTYANMESIFVYIVLINTCALHCSPSQDGWPHWNAKSQCCSLRKNLIIRSFAPNSAFATPAVPLTGKRRSPYRSCCQSFSILPHVRKEKFQPALRDGEGTVASLLSSFSKLLNFFRIELAWQIFDHFTHRMPPSLRWVLWWCRTEVPWGTTWLPK